MSKSVSNDALWEKLSEMDRKLNQLSEVQKSLVPIQEQVNISPELKANKDEIIEVFKRCIQGLGTHCDSHFKTIHNNITAQDEIIRKVWNIVARIRRQQRESAEQVEPQKESTESQKNDKETYFNFRIFKVRKTSFVITILGLLVFTLTIFCMKQQNDYSLLMDEYYRQGIAIQELSRELKVEEKQLNKQ